MRNRRDLLAVMLGLTLLAMGACSKGGSKGAGGPSVTDPSGVTGSPSGTAGSTTPGGTAATPAGTGLGGANGAGAAGKPATGGAAGSGQATAGNGSAGAQGAAGTGAAGMSGGGPTGASVLQYHKNSNRDGLYVDAAFTKAAVAKLHRDKSFNAALTGQFYAQPLYFEGGPGGKDLLIVASEQNEVTALDAASGAVVWQRKADVLGMPASSTFDTGGCGTIHPLGVTGTPVIDAASRMLYVGTMTTGGLHRIHALSLDDGSTPSGWPIDVSSVKAGSLSFNSPPQNQRGALIILNDTVFVPYGGHYGDCGDYHGWVVGVPLKNPSAAFGWATRGNAGGIWAPSGIASDGKALYVATGNTSGALSWADGEAVIRLGPDLKFSQNDPDYFATTNWSALDAADNDLGGVGPVLFSVPGATPSELAIALGKDGSAYLIDRTNLGGVGKSLDSIPVATGQIITAAAAYTTSKGTYVVFKGYSSMLTALLITAAAPPKITMAWSANPNGRGSPMVTSPDGKTDVVVWHIGAGGDNKLRGYDGDTGMAIFDGGGADEQLPVVDRFQTPIAAKGRIFVASESGVYAFSVN